jgi:radical SAM-linked protein
MSENQTTIPSPAILPDEQYRFRVTYSRGEALRYVSHLDTQLVWERTLRRAGVPLAYSQGFNPHPRLHMACALPLGFLSRCELIDFWIRLPGGSPAPTGEALRVQIQPSAPPGLEVHLVEQVAMNLPALQTLVQSVEYLATPLDMMDTGTLRLAAEGLIAQETLPRERRGKDYDLRPLIEHLEVEDAENPRLVMRLSAREGATGRPEELLDALGMDAAAFRVERTGLILAE